MKLRCMPLAAVIVLTTLMQHALYGQYCAPTVPTFVANLTGNPDSVWLSPPTVRVDTCCGVTNPDRCVQFIVTLDPLAQGIVMDIPEGGGCGARPTGSLFYQVNCGPQVAIGTPVCLSGPGPHTITFCKPGNNDNCYQITSFPGPGTSGDAVATDGCNALLGTVGYVESSIQWRSIPSNPTWESYLSCLDSCDTVTASALIGAPPFVDYQVCGRPLGDCDTTPVCDTLRVYFVSTLDVVIQPDSPSVCFGAGTTSITANVTGGAAPYTYLWTSGGVQVGGNSATLAVGPGTFSVEVIDTLNCAIARDTVVVTVFTLPIQALAGNDFAVCVGDSIFLNGQVQAASGGVWSGGTGTFTPNASTLGAHYFPSPGETAAGFVNLTLTTTGNGTCPAASDAVRVDIVPYPVPVIGGPSPVCQFSGAAYSTALVPGHTYLWSVSGGSITSGQGTSAISVSWAAAGAGSVTLTETNATGCDSTVSLPVLIQPRPIPLLGGPATVCQFDQATYFVPFTAGSSYLWAITGGTLLSGQNSTSIAVQWGAAGPGQVTLTETNAFGCDTTVSLAVSIQPKPSPLISGPLSSCAWTPATYSVAAVAGHTYAWTTSGGSILSGQGSNSISVQWQAAGPGSVSLLQTHPLGCDTTVNLSVTVLPNPVALITGPDSSCAFGVATPYASPANAGATYAWSISGGSILTGQGSNSITVAWASAGPASLSLLVTLPTGCDTSVSMPITVLPKPVPQLVGPIVVCAFRPQVYSTPPVAGDSYAWTVAGGSIVSGQGSNSITVQWASSGSGSVALTQTNGFGCDSSRTLAVTVYPTPQPLLSGPASACEFTAGHVYSTPALPGYGQLWTVQGGSIVSGQGSNSITVAWGAQGSGSVTLLQTAPASVGGCDTTVTLPVILYPVPDPLIVGPLSACAFSQGVAYSVTSVTGNSYLWTVTGGTISGGQGSPAITVSWLAPGAGSVSVLQTNTFGCDTTVQIAVNLLPQPAPLISGPTPVCAYQAGLTYSTAFVPGNAYLWTVSGGTITAGQGSNSVSVAWGGLPGTGTLNVTETHPLGCDSTVTFDVVLLPAPAPVINGSLLACAYSQSGYAGNADPAATITWSITGNGTILPGTSPELITVAWGAPGPAVLSVHYTYANGCDSSVSLPVTIQSAPIPIATGPDTVCQFSGHTYTTTAVPGVTYVWTAIGGTVTAGQGTATVEVEWSSYGNLGLELYAIAASGCDTVLVIPVHVLEGPSAVINPGELTICQPGLVTFDGSASLGEVGYAWTFGNGGSSNAPNPTSGFWVPGNYTIRLITTGPFACRDTAFAILHVQAGPYAEFTVLPGLEFVADIDTATFVNFSTQPASYVWDFGDGGTDTAFAPQHYYAEPGDYLVTLLVTDSLGCTATYQQLLTVIWELNLFVPNAFTPNGDALNDFFNVSHKNVLDFRLLIFSRWGELIYETQDKDFQWPGLYKSEPLQEGVYVWKLEATFLGGSEVVRSGSLTLIR